LILKSSKVILAIFVFEQQKISRTFGLPAENSYMLHYCFIPLGTLRPILSTVIITDWQETSGVCCYRKICHHSRKL